MRLKDKVSIITGAGRGIGKAYSLRFAKEGAKVVIADINLENAQVVSKEIESKGGEALSIKVDVSSEAETQEMAKKTVERFGRIDILVNNAAYMAECAYKPFNAWSIEEWDRCYAINVRGPWLCIKTVFPYMQAQGKGKIINIASGVTLFGQPFLLPYVSSKGAVTVLTRALARELGDYGIRVNTLSPGYIPETEGIRAIQGKPVGLDAMIIMGQCFKRQAHPEDLVGTCVFLASDDSDFITGQFIEVDGGLCMH